MDKLKYNVYEANLTDEKGKRLNEKIRFCTSTLRWPTLKEEIKNKERLIDEETLKMIYVTEDRNEARRMATEF